MLAISDMYEDCVVYQAQYQYFSDHVEVNALATKNYILRGITLQVLKVR